MHTDFTLIIDMGLVIIIGTVLAILAKAMKQPPMIAYIVAGILLGPFGLSLISSQHEISVLSELGVAFLLFIAGVELDVGKMKKVGKVAMITGILQVTITLLIGFSVSEFLGFNFMESIYIGLVVAFSSTMVVVKHLSETYRLNSLQGRISIGILLLQDIAVILALSLLGNLENFMSWPVFSRIIINGLGLVSIAVVMSKFIFPTVLRYSANSKETLFLVSVSTCFFFIGISYYLGFSVAIGGFIGGLALASYPYNIEIASKIMPLRDFFTVIFFATLGMQIDLMVMGTNLMVIGALLLILLIVKPLIIILILSSMGYGSRVPILTGLGLSQASEFSFVLARDGLLLDRITPATYSIIITLTVFTMALTPYMDKIGKRISKTLSRRFPNGFLIFKHTVKDLDLLEGEELKNHVVLLGCHETGREILDKFHDKEFI
ncbi:MAG: hypothetical protein DRP11_04245, partial [Candidatus Aenigmatarchaeota archaeon]